MMSNQPRLLYCNCTYAQVVPEAVKQAVLQKLCDSDAAFEAVADLCEMSARNDPTLQRLTDGDGLKIAACYPRAVKWLFAAANAPLDPNSTEIVNMRVESAETAQEKLLNGKLSPNVPQKNEPVPAEERTPEQAKQL